MPLQGLDFSRSNQALARFNQFLSYDLLDQMRSDRDVEVMKIQDRLMREREVEKGNIDVGVARYKSALTDKEAYTKAWIDLSAKPGMEADHMLAMLATNPDLPSEYQEAAKAAAKRWADAILPVAQAHYNVSRGAGTKEDFAVLNKFGGYKGAEEGYKEQGTNLRAERTAGIEEQKTAVEREKLGAAERGVSTKATDEKAKQYVDWIDKTVAFISGEGVKGNALMDTVMFLTGGKTRDPYAPDVYGKVLSDLQGLKRKILNGEPLTRGNEDYIIKVWNARSLDAAKEPAPGPAGNAAPVAPVAGGAGGGIPSPETGTRPAEYDQALGAVRQTWINQKAAEFIKAVYGETPPTPEIQAEAMKYATEYVDTRIMPTLMKR